MTAETRRRLPDGRRLRRHGRPERYAAPVFLAIALLLAWAGVAHASGSGWVQAVGAIAAGVIVVGMIGPGLAVRRLEVTATACARDARAGEVLTVELTAKRPLRCTPMWPPGEPVLLDAREGVPVTLALPTRGVLRTVSVRLSTAAPLGLLWWSVDHLVALPVPVEVAPRTGAGSSHSGEVSSDGEGRGRRVPAASGDVRGVRPYRSGDSRRRVHWRGSAHTGQLMVRESEQQPDASVRVVADLPDDPAAAERRAEEAMGTVVALLAAGRHVLLETVEDGRRRCAPISDRRHAGRRLAALWCQSLSGRPGEEAVMSKRAVTGKAVPETDRRERAGFIEMVRKANQPLPPENSMLFRLSTLVAVLAGVIACAFVGEVSAPVAVIASFGIAVGMTFSSATRERPWPGVKLLLAVAVVGVFVAFVTEIFGAAHTGELSSIEVPLASLFTWVQVVHAFDVPARRDLLFSLAAAAALLTVASAQAVSVGFLAFVAIWLVASMIGLACSWRSMAGGGGRLPAVPLVGATVLIVAIALILEIVLPLPRASQSLSLPSSLTSYLPLPTGGGLTEGGAHPAEPAQAGRPGGRIGVGGFVGMAGPLDTAVRAALGNEVVMRVRADRPGYFLGSTYDEWNGQSWSEVCPAGDHAQTLESASPFQLQYATGGSVASNVQTFYVEQNLPNLLFGTSVPQQVYFPAHSLIVACDHSLRSTIAMTAGTVYTVISSDDEVGPGVLTGDTLAEPTGPAMSDFLQLPHPYPRVKALALSIVREAHARTVVADVVALERWMGLHTRYSIDIPPLRPGQDAVDEFLFGNRTGYCEQISTALAVMLRTLGVPAREATGYIPGPFDPLSDLYTIEAKDAHAWVQVYVPGHDWQSFDPTAYVPLATPNPGGVLLSDLGHGLARLPWIPLGSSGFVIVGVAFTRLVVRRRRRRPVTWAAVAALGLERAGTRAGLPRRPAETLGEYGRRLAGAAAGEEGGPLVGDVEGAVRVLEESAYGVSAGHPPPAESRAAAERALVILDRSLRRKGRHLGPQVS